MIHWGKDWSLIHDKHWKCLEKAKTVNNKEVQDLSLKCSAWKDFNISSSVEVFKSLTNIGSKTNLGCEKNYGSKELLGLRFSYQRYLLFDHYT